MSKVSIVIPYWNGAEKIRRHLPEVLEFARTNNVEEIIASDDASTDETAELLKNEFPEAVLVKRKKNEGFSSNVNTGFTKASGDFILLLNSDATPKKDVLKFALPHFQNPKVFAVGCRVGDGLWTTGKFERGFFWHSQAGNREGKKGKENEANKTLWVSGGSSIFRKSLWDEMGGLDPLYNPFYVEDLDLGYRAWKRGYINIWEPKSIVEHYREKGVIESHFSRSVISSTAERNMLIFTWKNITSPVLTKSHQQALVKRLLQHPKYWTIFLSATKKLPQILQRREVEKRESKLADEEVLNIFEA